MRPTTAMASRCSCSTAAAAARRRRSTSKTMPATWATACSGCSRCGPQHVFSRGDGCWHSVESRVPQHAQLAWRFHCPSLSELKRVTGNELLETKRVCLRSASADAPRGPGPCVLNRTKTLVGQGRRDRRWAAPAQAHDGYTGYPINDPAPTYRQTGAGLQIVNNQLTVHLPPMSITVLVF